MEREQLDQLKASVDLVEVIRRSGLELKPAGKNLVARCPFHSDDTASFTVNPERGLFQCFGCGAAGDVLNYLQMREGLSFPAALDRLQSLAPGVPSAGTPEPRLKKMPAGVDGTELMERVANLYHENLARHEKALEYLAGRGLADFEMLRTFRVGYSCGHRLAEIAGEGQSRQALKALRLLNDKGREVFTGCIVVPLRDKDGQVLGFSGRRIQAGENPHRVLPGPRRGLFYPEAARGTFQVILVEGVLDALSCYQAGFRHVMALGGARGLTQELTEHLVREGVQEVLLSLDADEAGDEGSLEAGRRLSQAGLRCRRVRLPEGLDPAAFFASVADAQAVFRGLLSQAHSLESGSVNGPTSGHDVREPVLEDSEKDTRMVAGDLVYRARLLGHSNGRMRAHVHLSSAAGKFHRDSLDLLSYKSRRIFANRAADRMGVLPDEVANHLEALIDKLESALEDEERAATTQQVAPEMSPAEREQALSFLRQPDLLERILDDIEDLGYVGEKDAKLLVYLIASSRTLEDPLSGIIRSDSSAGKSFLVEMAQKLTPPEEVVLYSRLSPLALLYMAFDFLRHKLLVLEERVGGEAADYQIRTLQSKKRLSQAVVIKDPSTGRMRTRHYEVEGPIAYLETTTAAHLNPENTSRSFEIPLDESAEQTRRIQNRQREARALRSVTTAVRVEAICRRHHNAQRLLEKVRVVIPYAEQLTFPDRMLRARRDNERFLSLIEVVAFLHQFQRERGSLTAEGQTVEYIEATVEDYRVAYRLAGRVLGVSLDELSRWARELLTWLSSDRSSQAVRWTRRDLRSELGWPDRRLRESLDELVAMEYLETVRGCQGQAFVYQLAGPAAPGPEGLGLLAPEELERRLSRG